MVKLSFKTYNNGILQLPIKSIVKQGCILVPTLFNTCIDWIIRRVGKPDCRDLKKQSG